MNHDCFYSDIFYKDDAYPWYDMGTPVGGRLIQDLRAQISYLFEDRWPVDACIITYSIDSCSFARLEDEKLILEPTQNSEVGDHLINVSAHFAQNSAHILTQ